MRAMANDVRPLGELIVGTTNNHHPKREVIPPANSPWPAAIYMHTTTRKVPRMRASHRHTAGAVVAVAVFVFTTPNYQNPTGSLNR